jgi:hypothetical protein
MWYDDAVSQFVNTVIPGEPNAVGRDLWFDKLTTLSEVEGESRKTAENQIILDLPPLLAGDDELRHSLNDYREVSINLRIYIQANWL